MTSATAGIATATTISSISSTTTTTRTRRYRHAMHARRGHHLAHSRIYQRRSLRHTDCTPSDQVLTRPSCGQKTPSRSASDCCASSCCRCTSSNGSGRSDSSSSQRRAKRTVTLCQCPCRSSLARPNASTKRSCTRGCARATSSCATWSTSRYASGRSARRLRTRARPSTRHSPKASSTRTSAVVVRAKVPVASAVGRQTPSDGVISRRSKCTSRRIHQAAVAVARATTATFLTASSNNTSSAVRHCPMHRQLRSDLVSRQRKRHQLLLRRQLLLGYQPLHQLLHRHQLLLRHLL